MNQEKSKLVLAVIQFLESSSSDSDDYEALITNVKNTKFDESIEQFEQYNDKQFKDIYKINRTTVKFLANEFSKTKFYPSESNYKSSPFTHILLFVWFASHKCSIRTVAKEFKVSLTTCFHQILRVMKFLCSIASIWIKFPQKLKELKEIANEFKKISGFPRTIGCIGTMDIKIRRKDIHIDHNISSVRLQAICDYNHKFTNIFINDSGQSTSDIFNLSSISKDLLDICDKDFHILGNSNYEICEFLLTPFNNSEIFSENEIIYNNKLLATNMLINNTLVLLKGRFKQLECVLFQKKEKIFNFIIACCVLHNICVERKDYLESIEVEEDSVCDIIKSENIQSHSKNLGDVKRNVISDSLNCE